MGVPVCFCLCGERRVGGWEEVAGGEGAEGCGEEGVEGEGGEDFVGVAGEGAEGARLGGRGLVCFCTSSSEKGAFEEVGVQLE